MFGELLLELQLHMHARCRSVLHNELSSHEKLKDCLESLNPDAY